MKLHAFYIKLSLTLCLLVSASAESYAQIDSAFVSVNFNQQVEANGIDTVYYMNCAVDVYPLSNFGSVTIEILDTQTSSPVAFISMTKDELINAGLLVGNTISYSAEYIDPTQDYTIETQLRTDRGAHSPKIISYYEAP